MAQPQQNTLMRLAQAIAASKSRQGPGAPGPAQAMPPKRRPTGPVYPPASVPPPGR